MAKLGQKISEDRFFLKILWTDVMKVTLDRPDGWTCDWISHGHRAELGLRRHPDGSGVMVLAGIIKDELVGPSQIEEGLKLNSQTSLQFLQDTLLTTRNRKKSASLEKMIFMQDNSLSHALNCSTVEKALKMKEK